MSLFDGLPAVFASTFGRPVVYTRAAAPGAPLALTAIFTRRPVEIVLRGETEADGDVCTLDIELALLPALPAEGDTVEIPATDSQSAEGTFRVVPPIRRDGEGMATLMLEATA